MALSGSFLDRNDSLSTGLTSIATTSLSAATDVVRLVVVLVYDASWSGTPTLSGDGLTYTVVSHASNTLTDATSKAYIFKATGSPTAGALTASFSGGADYPEIAVFHVSSDSGAVVDEGLLAESGDTTLFAGNSYTVNADISGGGSGNAIMMVAQKDNAGTDPWSVGTGFTELEQWRAVQGNISNRFTVAFDADGGTDAEAVALVDSGNADAWLSAFEFSESAGGDTTAPTVSSAAVNAAGTTIAVQMDEAVSIGAGGSGGWTCSLSGVTLTAAVDGGDSTIVNLTPSRTIFSGESLTIGYTQPGDGFEDAAGNDLVTLSGQAVTNNSTQIALSINDPGAISFTIGTADTVDLTSTGWTDETWGVQ